MVNRRRTPGSVRARSSSQSTGSSNSTTESLFEQNTVSPISPISSYSASPPFLSATPFSPRPSSSSNQIEHGFQRVTLQRRREDSHHSTSSQGGHFAWETNNIDETHRIGCFPSGLLRPKFRFPRSRSQDETRPKSHSRRHISFKFRSKPRDLTDQDDLAQTEPPELNLPLRRAFSDPVLFSEHIRDENCEQFMTPASRFTLSQESVILRRHEQVTFDTLPREIKVYIFEMIVVLSIQEHEQLKLEGRWKGIKSRQRWVGEAFGRRELIKLGRVNKEWHDLTLDGQLWASSSKSPIEWFGNLLSERVWMKVLSSGTFLATLNLAGMRNITSRQLRIILDNSMTVDGATRLEYLNISGCSSLNGKTVIELLRKSPRLVAVTLSRLSIVSQETCDILGKYCLNLVYLDVSWTNFSLSLLPSLPSQVKALKAAGINTYFSPESFTFLRRFQHLETLDLSYSRVLLDTHFRQLLLSDSEDEEITLPWKRLNLSGCINLTDRFANCISRSVPYLEVFQCARIGSVLGPTGLIRLFENTPNIKLVDLEDAIDINNQVVHALTPFPLQPHAPRGKQPGSDLEHLIINNCSSITDASLLDLITHCTCLKRLEADGTKITEVTATLFVNIQRNRHNQGSLLSILDTRWVARQLASQPDVRPRMGGRGYWSIPFDYHEEHLALFSEGVAESAARLNECEESHVAVRSWAGHAKVDSANAIRNSARHTNTSLGLRRYGRRKMSFDDPLSCTVS